MIRSNSGSPAKASYHQPMALQPDQIDDREEDWPGKAERASRHLAVGQPKQREIHPVAEHVHAFLRISRSASRRCKPLDAAISGPPSGSIVTGRRIQQ
jgi:hypothetical protein